MLHQRQLALTRAGHGLLVQPLRQNLLQGAQGGPAEVDGAFVNGNGMPLNSARIIRTAPVPSR